MRQIPRRFTLIELVMAAAVICILTAIAVPAYQGHARPSEVSEGSTPAEPMPIRYRRIVTAEDADGKSYVLTRDEPKPYVEIPGSRESYRIWQTKTTPSRIPVIEDLDRVEGRMPGPAGSQFDLLVLMPDEQMTSDTRGTIIASQEAEKGLRRGDESINPLMHATNTIDYLIMLSGELWLVLDKEEILLRPGDLVVQGGVSHAWANRSDEPAVMVGVALGATRD